ncbi:MAG: hypothetical protein ACP5NZ_02210 [Nanobdellota archaeon]
MKKALSIIILSLLCLSLVAACTGSYCVNPIEKTIIKGKITYNGEEEGRADVLVTCFHDGSEYTRTTHSTGRGYLKGWYLVEFPQSECIAGDEVKVEATKGDLKGEAEGLVEDFTKQRCYDLDLDIIDVPLVPEFGGALAMLTALGALGVFFVIRRK